MQKVNFTSADFFIRSSAGYHFTTGMPQPLNEKQEAKLAYYYEKDAGQILHKTTKKPLSLSERDRVTMGKLIERKTAKPTLGVTAKRMLAEWVLARVFDQEFEFWNKYTHKGNVCEDIAIQHTGEFMERPFMIRYTGPRRTDKDFTGMVDVEEPDIILDIKNSYTVLSHPMLNEDLLNKVYRDQGNIYCELYGKPWCCFAYCLEDAPEELIEKEAYDRAKKQGIGAPTEDTFEEARKALTYSVDADGNEVPLWKRIKLFWVKHDPQRIKLLRTCAELCRDHIDKLIAELETEQSIHPPAEVFNLPETAQKKVA